MLVRCQHCMGSTRVEANRYLPGVLLGSVSLSERILIGLEGRQTHFDLDRVRMRWALVSVQIDEKMRKNDTFCHRTIAGQ